MKALHLLNACAWSANAVVWLAYAHVISMAVLSGIATVSALYLARQEP